MKKFEVTWSRKIQGRAIEKVVFTVTAIDNQEAVDRTTNFLAGAETPVPVLQVWECNMVNTVE